MVEEGQIANARIERLEAAIHSSGRVTGYSETTLRTTFLTGNRRNAMALRMIDPNTRDRHRNSGLAFPRSRNGTASNFPGIKISSQTKSAPDPATNRG